MFSPYYAWARGRGRGNPFNHCAINCILYGRPGARWAMTERGRDALSVSDNRFEVGPSSLTWEGGVLTCEINETTVPLPRPLRGRIRLMPEAVTGYGIELDAKGRHGWWPIAPYARVEVDFDEPALSWSGGGYFDTNNGVEPLEAAFTRWDWSRAHLADGSSLMMFDPTDLAGADSALAVRIDKSGRAEELPPPDPVILPKTGWRVNRRTRSDRPEEATVAKTLEDTPFYARSVVNARLAGEPAQMMHESLDLTRFVHPVVQMMLPFRMPRRAAWRR